MMKIISVIIVLACLAMAFSVFAKDNDTKSDENLSFREKISAQFK